jgi:hypothetical protein
MDLDYTSGLHPPVEYKVAVVVSADALGPVSLRIDEEGWEVASLLYDPMRFAITERTLMDGDSEVIFDSCDGRLPGYVGGFIVAEPACVLIRIVDKGRDDGVEWSAAIPFGVPVEPCTGSTSDG